jgi:transposase
VVASDIFGVSGRAMLAALIAGLIAGERDPKVLAQHARTSLRAKTAMLTEAFVGRFSDHHAFLLARMLGRIDQASADIAAVEAKLEAKLEAEIAPFASAVDRLDEITGVGRAAAHVIIAEIGIDMSRFPTAAHLVSWARFAPGSRSRPATAKAPPRPGTATPTWPACSAKPRSAPGGPRPSSGNATGASPAHRQRIARRRGAKKAIVAVGRSILIIVWHLLADPTVHYHDLGADFSTTRIDAERRKRNHVRQLQALGYTVTLQPAA